MSFFLSAAPENVPDNLSEKRHVFRIVQDAILLVFGERLLLCHKKYKRICNKDAPGWKIYHSDNIFCVIDFVRQSVFISERAPRSVLSYQHNQKLPAKAAPRWCLWDAAPYCAMLDARKYAFEAMMNGMPFIVVPETPASKKRYERYVWMEKGEVLFSEEAALDHLTEFGVWPRDNYFGEDPNEPFDD